MSVGAQSDHYLRVRNLEVPLQVSSQLAWLRQLVLVLGLVDAVGLLDYTTRGGVAEFAVISFM